MGPLDMLLAYVHLEQIRFHFWDRSDPRHLRSIQQY